MRFICFGYFDTDKGARIPPAEQPARIDRCFAYDDQLKKNGHGVGGEGLQGPESPVNLQHQNGKVDVTDGPNAETKQLPGGLLIIDAKDMKQAVQFISEDQTFKGALVEKASGGRSGAS